MKKNLRHIFAWLLCFVLLWAILPQTAIAAGASLTGNGTAKAGDAVTLTLSISGSAVYGAEATLNYDSASLEYVSYQNLSGWTLKQSGNKFVLYDDTLSAPINSGNLLSVTFKVKNGAASGTALSASFSGIVLTSKSSDKYVDSDVGTASWSGSVAAPPSDNCLLNSITVTNGTLSPAFSKNTTYYTVKVPYSVEKLNLDYNRADSGQTVSVNGNGNFVVGENTITLSVKAASGASKTYTIVVTREQDPNYKASTDATLAALTMEGATLSPAFSPKVTEYIAFVPHETKDVTITGTAHDEKAIGVTECQKTLNSDGETICRVSCTAEDGTTKQEYVVHVYRMPAYTGGSPLIEFTNEKDIQPPEVEEVLPTTYEVPMALSLPFVGDVSILIVGGAAVFLLLVLLFLLGLVIGRNTRRNRHDLPVDAYTDRLPADAREGAPVVYHEPVENPDEIGPADTAPLPVISPSSEEDVLTSEDDPDPEELAANEQVSHMSLDDLLNDIHNM